MDAIELLEQRTSCPALNEPAPTQEQLDLMFRAALRAPDHGAMKPYRFLTIQGAALEKLGEVYVNALLADDPEAPEAAINKHRRMPLRAPMILVAIAVKQEHPKVPVVEQVITAGCATQAVIQAAYAQGLGAMWRTGAMAHSPVVLDALGIKENEELIGFVYLGQPARVLTAPEADIAAHLDSWEG